MTLPDTDAKATAFAAVRAFAAESHDIAAAWIVAPLLAVYAGEADRFRVPLRLTRSGVLPRVRGSIRFGRILLGLERSSGRFIQRGQCLTTFGTENQRRVIMPIADRLPGMSVDLMLSERAASARDLLRAKRQARHFLAGLKRRLVPFLDEADVIRLCLLAERSRAQAEIALEAVSPAGVLVASSVTPDARALCVLARKAGIPTVYAPHAPLLAAEPQQDLPFDVALLRGSEEALPYAARGVATAKLVISGNPALEPSPVVRVADPGAPVVLALSPDPTPIVRAIIDSLRAVLPEGITVAAHPRQDMRSLVAMVPPGWELATGRTYDLLRSGASTVVQYSSGIGLEAMLLGIPCIELSLFGHPPAYPFLDHELVQRVTRVEDLPDALNQARHFAADGDHQRSITDWAQAWCARSGAAAAAHAAAALEDVLGDGAPRGPIWDYWADLQS